MAGIRKNGKINHLIDLNKRFKLGYSKKEIELMSVSQLKRIIYNVKKEHDLTIPISSSLRKNEIE